jgi:hypothetical protein
VKYEEVCRQRNGILTSVTMSPKQYFPAVFSNIRSSALKPFAMESCAHFSRSSLPSFASITGCSAMHKLKLLRLSDMNEPNPAILSVSGSEHDKKWLRHETHQDLCVLQRLDIRCYQKHHLMNMCSLYKIFWQKRPFVRKSLLQILQMPTPPPPLQPC